MGKYITINVYVTFALFLVNWGGVVLSRWLFPSLFYYTTMISSFMLLGQIFNGCICAVLSIGRAEFKCFKRAIALTLLASAGVAVILGVMTLSMMMRWR